MSGKEKKKLSKKDRDSSKSNKSKKTKKSKQSKKSKASSKKEKKSSKASKSTKKKSKKSSGGSSKTSKKLKDPEIFMKLPEDFFNEIVKLKLQTYDALVIESLDSIFIRRPLLALNAILKGTGNIKYVHFFLLTYTFEQCKAYEDKKKQSELDDITFKKQNRIKEIMKMSQEEYLQLTEDDKKLFKEVILSERKQKSLARKMALMYTI